MRLPIKFLRNAFIREKTECNKVASSALSRGTKCMHFGGKNRSWRQRLIELVCTPAREKLQCDRQRADVVVRPSPKVTVAMASRQG